MTSDTTPQRGLLATEILHIDTVGSQDFFSRLDTNQSEKCECQRLLHDLFSQCCQKYNGNVAGWAGDGGHALFDARLSSGSSIRAAKEFIVGLNVLSQQTATILGRRVTSDLARRSFRIKAHFGLVRFGECHETDSASPDVLDGFLKYEKSFAPLPDELFITKELRAILGAAEKEMFALFKENVEFGEGTKTSLYRLQWRATNHARSIFEHGLGPQDVTDSEWQYLRTHILTQRMNVVARNSITTNLVKAVSSDMQSGHLNGAILLKLTLQALYNYLRAVYPYYSFGISVWRPLPPENRELEKVACYPPRECSERRVRLDDVRYLVVRAFNSCGSIVTPSVGEARLTGDWVDFDQSQTESTRGLHSAIQMPIYRTTVQYGDYLEKESLAVLSVESDKPDFFQREEADMWADEFVGYLANLALAETLHRAELVKANPKDQRSNSGTIVELKRASSSPISNS